MDKQKKLRLKLFQSPKIVLDYIVDLEMKIEAYEDIIKDFETTLQDNEISKASLIVEFNKIKRKTDYENRLSLQKDIQQEFSRTNVNF